MGLKCGIVGLPNVGKSTLFNALTSSESAEAANYPFCTIEPNNGVVNLPDERLDDLAKMANSQKKIPAIIEFVDIAGLVSGASQGEGLGNKFLSHIREVDAIIHVVRCFEDSNITHVHGKVDPIYDTEIIETELIMADLETIEKKLLKAKKMLQNGDKSFKAEVDLLEIVKKTLEEGHAARSLSGEIEEHKLKELQIITTKPVLYVCNVGETEASTGNDHSNKVQAKAKEENAEFLVISSKIEEEISQLDTEEEKLEFLKEIGLNETGLSKIIKSGYNLLGLESFFTVGEKEARAWTYRSGTLAPQAAGIIHTDFERGFIRAEVISYNDYSTLGGEVKAKEAGKVRLEGKDYMVKDGDIIHFRFNV